MASTIAPDVDRLPWLTDDHVRRPKRPNQFVGTFLAASAVAIIAAVSFWLGMSGVLRPGQQIEARSGARVDLPPPSPSAMENAQPAPVMPEVEPALSPPPVALPTLKDVRIEAPPVRRTAKAARLAAHRSHPAPAKTASSKEEAAAKSKGLTYTNPWESADASGRMIRVGAYTSLEQGKEAWSRLAKFSPAIRQLPAVVTDIPSKSGRVYYWLQIGTTSQAHSEVLCQRMRSIRQSCVVVDLAGARKGSGDERQPVSL